MQLSNADQGFAQSTVRTASDGLREGHQILRGSLEVQSADSAGEISRDDARDLLVP